MHLRSVTSDQPCILTDMYAYGFGKPKKNEYPIPVCDFPQIQVTSNLHWQSNCSTSTDNQIVAALRDIIKELQNLSPASPLAPVNDNNTSALNHLEKIFSPLTEPKALSPTTNNIPASFNRVLPETTPVLRVTPTVAPGFAPIQKPSNRTINTNIYT